MSLVKFSADLKYSSKDADHESKFRTTPECDANQTLVNLVEHAAWMAAVGGNGDAAREAFENGFKTGIERLKYLISIKGLHPVTPPKEICGWFHPDFKHIDPMADNDIDRGYTPEEWKQIEDVGQIDITIDVRSIGEIEEALGRETDGEWDGWKPEPPTPHHFLIAAFDTEHVECVLWWAKRRDVEDTQEEA